MSSVLGQEDKKRIEALIQEMESKSSVEFVVAEIPRSAAYAGYRAFATGALTFIMAAMAHMMWPHISASYILILQLPLALFSWVVCGIRPVLLTFTPNAREALAVQERAEQLFFERELFNTKERSAVLIMLSAFEHRITIMADKGVFAHLNDAMLKEYIQMLTAALGRKDVITGLRTVMTHISDRVADKLSPRSRDQLASGLRD